MALRRAAIYGGTFDPVHQGHFEVAARVSELFELEEVIFVPACVPPHKRNASITSAFHRFAMLALATEHEQRMRISTVELDMPDRPYAVDTVARLQQESGSGRRIFFMIGADSWNEIDTWHEWETLLKMCDLIVSTRPGYDLNKKRPTEANVVDVRRMSGKEISGLLGSDSEPRVFLTDAAMADVSATAIRLAARTAYQTNDWAELREMVPDPVANYIEKYGLYKN